jgi:hypothetical protein
LEAAALAALRKKVSFSAGNARAPTSDEQELPFPKDAYTTASPDASERLAGRSAGAQSAAT